MILNTILLCLEYFGYNGKISDFENFLKNQKSFFAENKDNEDTKHILKRVMNTLITSIVFKKFSVQMFEDALTFYNNQDIKIDEEVLISLSQAIFKSSKDNVYGEKFIEFII